MPDSTNKDTFGYLGHEDMTPKELLRCLATALEQMAKSEGAEALELARSKAREMLDKLEPVVASSASARSHLEESVRKQPLLSLAIAGAVGFLLASLGRR